ncbi:M20/M25/M40 family metallo-hydrolase [Amycolatopsis sp. NPDC005232]|uniref:M20/M25/M40 family metallo-hydrolase n=1 Tax=Amycolatopsis sp. NPDC005232 TaxID=3157027 RepID=UPI00339DCA2C
MEIEQVRHHVEAAWADRVLPSLAEFVAIPAVSPAYDAQWRERGHLRRAVEHVRAWIEANAPAGSTVDVVELDGVPPLLFAEIPATPGAAGEGTALLYGHLDKQPPFDGWSEGLGPWQPVLRGDRLYGRGAVDDGYAAYAALTAVTAVRAGGGEHCRVVLVLEAGEESGSPGLPDYLDHLADRLGRVSLVTCLDSGGGDFQRLWVTRSLRGILQATLTVAVLQEAVHSGIASGVVPSSFRILRLLLDRLEDPATGRILLPELNAPIPPERVADAQRLAELRPLSTLHPLCLVPGSRPAADDEAERILNNTWRPTLSVTGAAGLPDVAEAGAVLRASTSLRLSFRLPPTVSAADAAAALERVVTTDVPFGASAALTDVMAQDGWCAPEPPAWLSAALESGVFEAPHQFMGLGGGIPFMQMLGQAYSDAAFLVTGAVGAESNMHVPDEWLNIPFARQVTEAVAHVLAAHALQR